jgi:hypothetical protein
MIDDLANLPSTVPVKFPCHSLYENVGDTLNAPWLEANFHSYSSCRY